MNRLPTVAIVGRMNVGKSTLFNRLTETQHAITSSWAGTTRDVNTASVLWRGMQFDLQDTGGLDVEDDEQLEERVIEAAQRAIEEASVVIYLVDGVAGLLPKDKELVAELRNAKVPVILAINKLDNDTREMNVDSAVHALDFDASVMISAKNGRGTGDLLDAVMEALEGGAGDAQEEIRRTKVAIVGRPNVGKSSLLNAILGEDRVIVADKAHTTRDTNDIPYTYKDHDFLLTDTAGLRRRSRVGRAWSDGRLADIEKKSVGGSLASVDRADVVVLVLEAQKRVTQQDKKIAQLVESRGKALIVVINKWDLIPEKEATTINDFTDYFDSSLPFLRWAPMAFVSAIEGLRVRELLDLVLKVGENYEREVEQEELDTVLAIARGNYKPKQVDTRKYKKTIAVLKHLEQIGARPPHFYLKAKNPRAVPKAIVDIVRRELYDRFDFDGVQIVVEVGD